MIKTLIRSAGSERIEGIFLCLPLTHPGVLKAAIDQPNAEKPEPADGESGAQVEADIAHRETPEVGLCLTRLLCSIDRCAVLCNVNVQKIVTLPLPQCGVLAGVEKHLFTILR